MYPYIFHGLGYISLKNKTRLSVGQVTYYWVAQQQKTSIMEIEFHKENWKWLQQQGLLPTHPHMSEAKHTDTYTASR